MATDLAAMGLDVPDVEKVLCMCIVLVGQQGQGGEADHAH